MIGEWLRREAARPDERGFSLMEAIVATVIATIAVLGLASSFGTGRGLINRYEVGRAALAVAQGRMESFATMLPGTITSGSQPFLFEGEQLGTETWTVTDWDDPLTPNTKDMVLVTETVSWGSGFGAQSLGITRLFPRT